MLPVAAEEARHVKLGLHLGYWGSGPVDMSPLVRAAEESGFDSIWSAEAYGSDAVVTLTWYAAQTTRINVGTAIMQMPARSPAATAMTAITLDHLTQGRFLLGLGTSGPQVAEGWHGQPFGKPLARSREYVEIVRRILRRDEPVEFHGEYYDVPASAGTGLGKPLKTIVHPFRNDIPIYLASIGPKNVELTAEIADGWLPAFYSPQHPEAFEPSLKTGFDKAGKDGSGFDIAPFAPVFVGDDLQQCRDLVKPLVALYVGGMGARERNFYNELVQRYGYEAEAKAIQDLYLDGKKAEATAAVPDALVDEVALLGSKERIRDQLPAWKEAGVTTLIAGTLQIDAVHALSEAAAAL
jgi:F420-dependent oxidoreductase-like protein